MILTIDYQTHPGFLLPTELYHNGTPPCGRTYWTWNNNQAHGLSPLLLALQCRWQHLQNLWLSQTLTFADPVLLWKLESNQLVLNVDNFQWMWVNFQLSVPRPWDLFPTFEGSCIEQLIPGRGNRQLLSLVCVIDFQDSILQLQILYQLFAMLDICCLQAVFDVCCHQAVFDVCCQAVFDVCIPPGGVWLSLWLSTDRRQGLPLVHSNRHLVSHAH